VLSWLLSGVVGLPLVEALLYVRSIISIGGRLDGGMERERGTPPVEKSEDSPEEGGVEGTAAAG
jgi:hypothetical protein